MKKKKNFRIKIHERQLFDQYEEVCYEKTQMDEGGCLYAGPAFAEWIGTGGARAYIINGQVQTGWQQIDGKWYYLNEQGAPQIGWVKDGEKQYFCTASGEMVSGVVWINGKTYYFGTPDSERWQRALSVSTEFLIRLKTMAHRSAVASRDRREALR